MFSFFSNYSSTQFGFFSILFLLAVSKGGRTPLGLILYYFFSLFLLYQSKNSLKFYRTKLDPPLLGFGLVCLFSTVYSLISHGHGLIYFTAIAIHILNYYLFCNVKDEKFVETFLKQIEWIALGFALALLILHFKKCDLKTIFPNENLLSSLINCGFFIALARYQYKDGAKALELAALLILCLVQFYLSSRGGLISLSITLLWLTAFDWKKGLRSIEILLGLTLATLLLKPHLMAGIGASFSNSLGYGRIILWKGAFQAFLSHPIFGWGLGNFGGAYQQYKLPIDFELGQFEKTTSFAHNEFLDILVQMGLIGWIVYLWLIFSILRESVPALKNSKEDWKKGAASLSIIALIVHSFFDFNFHLPMLAFLFLCFSSIILDCSKESSFYNFLNYFKKGLLPAMILTLMAFSSILLRMAADHYENNRENDKAILLHEWSYRLNPFELYSAERLSYLLEGTKSEEWLKKALRVHWEEDSLYERLAVFQLQKGNFEEAIFLLEKATYYNPKFPFYYSELGEIYEHTHHPSKALELYKKAILLEPLFSLAHFRTGTLYLEQSQNLQAKKYFENALKIGEANINSDSPYVQRLINFDSTLAKASLKKITHD